MIRHLLFFILLTAQIPILSSQVLLDGIFDGTAIWGNAIYSGDGNEGWASANAKNLYYTSDSNYHYLAAEVKASPWMQYAFLISSKKGGGSNDSWGRSIQYNHTNLPDYILRGNFSGYAEFHSWNNNNWANTGTQLPTTEYAENISIDNQDGFIEIRIPKSSIDIQCNLQFQVILTGDQNNHATFDAVPDDENAIKWDYVNEFTSLKNYHHEFPTVSISPQLPDVDVPVTITFDASCTELSGVDKVYFHSGVSTTILQNNNFDHTIGNWGQDDGVGLMTNLGNDQWSITINSLTSYYPVSSEDDIFGLNFLFRNSEGTIKEDAAGTNYHVLTNPGNYFILETPPYSPFLVPVMSSTNISATSSNPNVFWNLEMKNSNGSYSSIYNDVNIIDFNYEYHTNDVEEVELRLGATWGTETKYKTFSVSVYSDVVDSLRPVWTKPGINYHEGDASKVTLVLHTPVSTKMINGYGQEYDIKNTAPKNVVYVIGDFNNWSTNEPHKMYRDRDGWDGILDEDNDGDHGDYWWITLDNLNPNETYTFQYLIDGLLQVADPYCEQVIDMDDQYIDPAIYPGLPQYPIQAIDRASSFTTNQQEYQWCAPSFQKPNDNELNIYELHFRDFTEDGTYLAAINKLDYIKNLGINAIHVLPVSEFEGNSSWGYNPNFYFAPDKAYGTKNDLKKFIDECHKREILVFNDLVLNHAFYSNIMARLWWDSDNNRPAAENPFFNDFHRMVANPAGWWGADWNHESEHTFTLMNRIIDFWLQEYRFDGYRFDFTKGIGQSPQSTLPGNDWASFRDDFRIALLERMINGMKSRNPGSVAIFEHLAAADEDKILADQGILMWSGVPHHNAIKNFVLGYNNDNPDLYSTGVYNAPGRDFAFANWMSYPESHDEQRLGYEVWNYGNGVSSETNLEERKNKMIERLKLGWAFNLFLPGPRMIWQFGELGYEVDINFNGRTGEKPVRWEYYQDNKRKELYRLMSSILKIRSDINPYASIDFGNIGLSSNNISTPRIMKLGNAGNEIIVIGNLDPFNSHSIQPQYPTTGNWYKYNGSESLDGSSFSVASANDSYLLNPSEVVILTNFQLYDCSEINKSDDNTTPNTLRSALACSQNNDILNFSFPVFEDTITLNTTLDIDKSISILSDLSENVVIDGRNCSGSVLSIADNEIVSIKGVKILCNNDTNSPCILNDGNLHLEDVVLIDQGSIKIGSSPGKVGKVYMKNLKVKK